jgi:hypothetical protein
MKEIELVKSTDEPVFPQWKKFQFNVVSVHKKIAVLAEILFTN